MASHLQLTDTPQSLPSTTAGVNYAIQNRAAYPMYLQKATSAPSDDADAYVLGPMGVWDANHAAGESIFVWQETAPAYGRVVWDVDA